MNNYDFADTESHEQAQARAGLRDQMAMDTEESDFKQLMGCAWGRRFVWGILERGGLFRLSFNENPLAMAFNEGRKNEALRTQVMIHSLCPELYAVMVKEKEHDNRNTDDPRTRAG